MTVSEVFLDTNILVYSSLKDFDEEKHSQCQKVIKNLNKSDFSINISTQILREFYAVVTGKRYLTQPLAPDEAKEQILYFKSVFDVKEIPWEVISKLLSLVDRYEIKGQKIHDATIVATMINYNIPRIMTYNKRDFSDYQEIETIGPAELIDEMNGGKDERENETGEQAESAD